MRFAISGVVFLAAFAPDTITASDDKGGDVIVLKRAELEKVEGTWELKAQPKEGWKGTVRATIELYPVGSAAADFGNILFDFDLTNENEKLEVRNAPSGGIDFAAVKLGATQALVRGERRNVLPFKVKVKDGLLAPFEVKDDKLTFDLSKSLKAFVPGTAQEIKIDWSKTTREKVKK